MQIVGEVIFDTVAFLTAALFPMVRMRWRAGWLLAQMAA